MEGEREYDEQPPAEQYAAESPMDEGDAAAYDQDAAAYDQDAAVDAEEPAAQMDEPSPQMEVCRIDVAYRSSVNIYIAYGLFTFEAVIKPSWCSDSCYNPLLNYLLVY